MNPTTATIYNLDQIRRDYLGSPDEAVFLERARILADCIERFSAEPPGMRQGRTFEQLCGRITPVVSLSDTLVCRVREEAPSPADEEFVRCRGDLFTQPGAPECLESAGLYAPDWGHLLATGIGGLIREVEAHRASVRNAGGHAAERRDYLDAVALSLTAISTLARRYEEAARNLARRADAGLFSARLMQAANSCAWVAEKPPRSLRDALQLYVLYHMVLSCIAGGRNVTPGRMDQWLRLYWDQDVSGGRIPRREGVELLAVAMISLSQLSGRYSTDFQSAKRTPCRHSHYYITLAGSTPEGKCAVNDLSFAILEALRLVGFREPSVMIRYTDDIDRRFWREALAAMRERLPVFAYNDRVVIEGLIRHGMAPTLAREYVHAGCMNCITPGAGPPALRDNFDMAAAILATMENAGGAADFDAFFRTLCAEVRSGIARHSAGYAHIAPHYPLPAWPLFCEHLAAGHEYCRRQPMYVDLHLTSVATAVDSLLAIDRMVYRDHVLTVAEFLDILRANYAGHEAFRQYLLNRVSSYGSDDGVVLDMIERVGGTWVEEVEAARYCQNAVVLRPGFHSWLFNVKMGETTGATPDGRLKGEHSSSDLLPASALGRGPTEILRSISRLPLDHTPSGGTTFVLDTAHFDGPDGIDRLAALIEGHFAEGGLQLHFIFTNQETLLDAVKHPDRHADLLVRVTGFSEYFVRLLPEVQQDIIQRAAR